MDLIMKLVALGDSIIKGVLFNKEENGHGHYSLSDHNIAHTVADSMHCEVMNLGKMGCTVEAGERILERYIDTLDGTKYVLMCFGGNDSDYNWKAIADSPTEKHYPKTLLRTFEKTYARVINKVREIGFTPLIMSLPPMDAQQYFDFFTSTFTEEQKSIINDYKILQYYSSQIQCLRAFILFCYRLNPTYSYKFQWICCITCYFHLYSNSVAYCHFSVRYYK